MPLKPFFHRESERAALCNRWLHSTQLVCLRFCRRQHTAQPFMGWRLVQHHSLQTSAGRQCLGWLRLSCQNICFRSVEFETRLPEWSHQFLKHIAKLFGRSCKQQKVVAKRRSNNGGPPYLKSNPLLETAHRQSAIANCSTGQNSRGEGLVHTLVAFSKIAKAAGRKATLPPITHTLVARQPWCKIHGSHPSVHWCVPYGLNTTLLNNQTSSTDTPYNCKPRQKTSQCSNSFGSPWWFVRFSFLEAPAT